MHGVSKEISILCTLIDRFAVSAQYCRISKNLKMDLLLSVDIKDKIFPTNVL